MHDSWDSKCELCVCALWWPVHGVLPAFTPHVCWSPADKCVLCPLCHHQDTVIYTVQCLFKNILVLWQLLQGIFFRSLHIFCWTEGLTSTTPTGGYNILLSERFMTVTVPQTVLIIHRVLCLSLCERSCQIILALYFYHGVALFWSI